MPSLRMAVTTEPLRSDGVQFIVFDREAASPVEAVRSAINDIERTPRLKVIRIADTDLISHYGIRDCIKAKHPA